MPDYHIIKLGMSDKRISLLSSIRFIVFILLLTGCGNSLFPPSTTDNTLTNPELSLERANYLYLGGNAKEADEIYLALINIFANDEENTEIYFNAIRGHSKCTLDMGQQSSADALESFFIFVQSIDVETFALDENGQSAQEAFGTTGTSFKEIAWKSFTILLDIPQEQRTEADYSNMSISGLFTVCVDFLTLMVTTVNATNSIMEKIAELSAQAGDFVDGWSEAEVTYGTDPIAWPAETIDEIKAIAVTIDALYSETVGTLLSVEGTMELLLTETEQVTAGTTGADNSISLMLNGVFTVVFEIVDTTLTLYNEMQNTAGEFYDQLITAIGW